MSAREPIEGVYLSSILDLEELLRTPFAPYRDHVRLRTPDVIENPEKIRFAVCWHPSNDAFVPYTNLKLASSIAAGVDSLISCPSLPADAAVTRVHDTDQADAMAGFVAWHLVWHHRNMCRYLESQSRAEWASLTAADYTRPSEMTVGILGYGVMGIAVARAARALGFKVVAARSRVDIPPADDGVAFECGEDAVGRTAARSDFLVNVLPLTAQTRGILNRDLFRSMPRGSFLIQIGRGDHLIEQDLNWALDEGYLAGASVDVFQHEPLPPDHPWWRDPRIVVTPHIASFANPAVTAAQIAEAAVAVTAGEVPKYAIDRSRGY